MAATRARSKDGRRAANYDRLTSRLLDAVEATLEQGETYAELSIERLLDEAGVARSTFYYHFKDKNQLIADLAGDVLLGFQQGGMSWWQGDSLTRETFQAAVEQIFEVYWRHRVVMSAAAEIAAYDADLRRQYDGLWSHLISELADRIRTQQVPQRRDVDADRTAAWFVWMTERGLYHLVRHADPEELKGLAAAHVDIVWTTFSRQP